MDSYLKNFENITNHTFSSYILFYLLMPGGGKRGGMGIPLP